MLEHYVNSAIIIVDFFFFKEQHVAYLGCCIKDISLALRNSGAKLGGEF